MNDLIITISIFIVTVITHILIHRFLAKLGIITFKTILLFPVGYAASILFVAMQKFDSVRTESVWTSYAPISILFVNLLAMILYIMLFASFFFEGESPSGKLLFLIRQKPQQLGSLFRYFTNDAIVKRRLELLVRSGLVVKIQSRYKISSRGKFLVSLLSTYRKILRWDKGG